MLIKCIKLAAYLRPSGCPCSTPTWTQPTMGSAKRNHRLARQSPSIAKSAYRGTPHLTLARNCLGLCSVNRKRRSSTTSLCRKHSGRTWIHISLQEHSGTRAAVTKHGELLASDLMCIPKNEARHPLSPFLSLLPGHTPAFTEITESLPREPLLSARLIPRSSILRP
jgi:hypothetical protein